MDKKLSTFTVANEKNKSDVNTTDAEYLTKNAKGLMDKGDIVLSSTSSHTHFYKKPKHEDYFKRVTRNEYLSISETISGSSETFQCEHGPEGKRYTEKGLLKRNILKNMDPVPVERRWTDECAPAYGTSMAKKLEFLVHEPTIEQQLPRLECHLRDFAKISSSGYTIDILDSLCVILDYLAETSPKFATLQEGFELLLKNLERPILLKVASDVVKYFDTIQHYIGFLAYLLMRLESDVHFDMVSKALIWQLSAPDSVRGQTAVQLRHCLASAASSVHQSVVRMIAVSSSHRFPTFLQIALLLACDTVDNCIQMMKENVIENIFYRFNPYFPNKKLSHYDINPANTEDYNVKLGDSSVHMPTTLSLLLVLLKTTKHFLEENPNYRGTLPSPDCYSQRCFIWAYRYESRARGHHHERNTLTVVLGALLHCFGDRLMTLSAVLMPDIMSLSVSTELPPMNNWTRTVNINTSQMDVQFKKTLITLSVDFLKVFPYNKFMVESRQWLMGLMYLLDPGLCRLRARWSASLYAEIRKIALQALVCTLSLMPDDLIKDYGLIRRLMWYIEWYSESPYELAVLYWCLRVLQVATFTRGSPNRKVALRDLFDTHGIIIIINLCHTLMEQKLPPVEKSQAIISLCLRIITSAVEENRRVSCCVYPHIKWPNSIDSLAGNMLDTILYSLDKHFIISDKWTISLLNLLWEAIVWRTEYRENFVANNGAYKLLDLITMSGPTVQCIALALLCDIARAGDAVGQMVTWRAKFSASEAHPCVVKRGATIASLLAAIFRDECKRTGVRLNDNGVLEDLDNPIMSSEVWKEMNSPDHKQGKSQRTTVCYPAADLAGSRLSKVFALLHMLSEDLKYRVSLADEAYNMYKNIKLAAEDEAILVLCSHYLTLKLNEAWTETEIQNPGLLKQDELILDEFRTLGKGWAKEIRRQQEKVIENDRKQALEEECSLYAFLGCVRLNVALDALRAVRCVARSADRTLITHVLLQDAVRAHHRRSVLAETLAAPVLRVYRPPLDDQNITGQNVKVYTIHPKENVTSMELSTSLSSHST